MTASRPYAVDLLRLAGPVALARLGIIGMAIADVVVVGQLAPTELPHQALGWAPTAVFLVSAIGLLQGVQVLAARSLGEGNPRGAGVVLRRGLVLALIAGLLSVGLMWWGGERLFSTFGVETDLVPLSARVMNVLALSIPLHLLYIAGTYFLEAIKKPAVSTIVMWLANAANLALNLLWVPDLNAAAPAGAEPFFALLRDQPLLHALHDLAPAHGAIGSAWATVGARVFLSGGLLLWIVLLRDGAAFGVRSLGAKGFGYASLLAVGIASAVSQAVEAGAFSGMTVIAGRLGASVVAGYQILLNLMAFVFMLALGMAAATAVLVSEAIGRKAPHDAARAGWTGIGVNALCMIAAAIAIYAFKDHIAHAYTADLDLAAKVLAPLIWICALVLHPDGAQVVTASALRARGDNWFPTFSHIVAYAVVMPVLGYWFAEHLHMQVAGLLFAILCASVLSAAVLLLRWWAIAGRPAPAHGAEAPIAGVAEGEVRDR